MKALWTVRTAFSASLILLCSSARADITLLNQFANSGAGNLPVPIAVAVGPTGNVLLTSDISAQSNSASIAMLYSSDGSFIAPLLPGANQITYSDPHEGAFSPSGTVYSADSLKERIGVFGSNGVGQSVFGANKFAAGPYGLATDATGNIFASNRTVGQSPDLSQVLMFNAAGTLINTFNVSNNTAASSAVSGIAVDNVQHLLYLHEASAHKIEVFSTAGVLQSTIGDPNSANPGYINGGAFGETIGVSGTGRVYVPDFMGGIQVFSTGGTYLETVATTISGQAFLTNGVAVTPTGIVYATGVTNLTAANAGAYRFFDPAAWSSGTNTFTNPNTGPTSVAVGTGGLLGSTFNLDATKGLNAVTVGVNSGGVFNVSGGTLTATTINVDGSAGGASLTMTSGSLTASNVNVTGGGVAAFAGSPANATLSGTVTVSGTGSQFKVDQGATFTSSLLNNTAQVTIGNVADYIVQNSVTNNGTIAIAGGGLDVRGTLKNSANSTIQLGGAVTTLNGLINNGLIQMSGNAHVFGSLTNNGTGNVVISGLQPNVFHGKVINNGTMSIDAGSSATFQGVYSGANGVTGGGTAFIDGTLQPGDPVTETFSNLHLNAGSQTVLQFAGSGPNQYDQVHTTGQLSLGGTLNVALIGGFMPARLNKFDILDWTLRTGTFSALQLPAISGSLGWNVSNLYSSGVLSVVDLNRLPGDMNLDGQITSADVPLMELALVNKAGYESLTGATPDDLATVGDADESDTFDNRDLQALLFEVNSGTSFVAGSSPPLDAQATSQGSQAAVPEPSSILLLLCGAAILAYRTRRVCRHASGQC